MKRKITLLLLAAGSIFTLRSQVVLQEDFTAPFTPATAGWGVQNLSSPIGALSWFQGNGAFTFPAFNGSINDYYAVNYNSQAATPGGISNWMFTPVVSIYNGAVFQFATRTTNTGAANFAADRLQLRMSGAGTASTVPSGTASVGTFTTLLLDINPNLTLATSSVVNNGTVNGYPNTWAVYTVAITGVTGTVTGRFALRYFVNDGGNGGLNSDYIGIDAVKYTLPCGVSVLSQTICSGVSATLNALGGLPATNYLWSNAATSSSIVVNPATTTVYTLAVANGTDNCGNPQTVTVTVGGNQLSMGIIASTGTTTICSGNTVVLTAFGSATSFSWNTGAITPVITVTPNTTTTYSIGGLNGFCFGGTLITINTIPSPTLGASISPTAICPNTGTINITSSGATTYTFDTEDGFFTSNPAAVAISSVAGVYAFGLYGTGANGCISSGVGFYTVSPNPTVTVGSSKPVICVGNTVALTALGANSYIWSGAASATNTTGSLPYTGSSGATGNQTFSVVGTNSEGCTGNAIVTVSVSACLGIEKINSDGSYIFPNPFNSVITISGLEGQVQIFNALGQLVLNIKTSNSETINTSELTKGAYQLKAYNNEGELVRTIKLLKH